MPKSTNPNDTPDRMQFYINELGPLLAKAAATRARTLNRKWTLTDEARFRLEQSFAAEGVDMSKAREQWEKRRNAQS